MSTDAADRVDLQAETRLVDPDDQHLLPDDERGPTETEEAQLDEHHLDGGDWQTVSAYRAGWDRGVLDRAALAWVDPEVRDRVRAFTDALSANAGQVSAPTRGGWVPVTASDLRALLGEPCPHTGGRTMKYDGGDLVELCGECSLVLDPAPAGDA